MFTEDTQTLHHPPGMLYREQRTAMTATARENHSPCLNYLRCQSAQYPAQQLLASQESQDTNNTRSSKRSKKSKTYGNIRKLADIFFCVLFVLCVSVPSSRADRRHKWTNPSGFRLDDIDSQASNTDYPPLSDFELLTNIVIQGEQTLDQAKSFTEEYVRETFRISLIKHHKKWVALQYTWLPTKEQIPKGLGEPVSQDHLSELKLDSALVNTYENLQRFAVGLEQVVQQSNEFKHFFRTAEFELLALLAEIQSAILEKDIKPKDDVNYDIMDNAQRNLKEYVFRNLRDWLIYRDYINMLEYVVTVFKHLKSKI